VNKKDSRKSGGKRSFIKGVVFNPAEGSNPNYKELGFDSIYFGHCFYPEHNNFHIPACGNWGVENFFICPLCNIKWSVGQGLFSLPTEEMLDCSIEEYIIKNSKRLEDFDDFTGKHITWEEYLKLKKDVDELKKP
jgi:hypothetical protein